MYVKIQNGCAQDKVLSLISCSVTLVTVLLKVREADEGRVGFSPGTVCISCVNLARNVHRTS